MKNLKKWLWPDSHYGQLVLALLIGAAALQAINMYAVCYIQHSYNKELHKVRYDYDSSIYLALTNMNDFQRKIYLNDLAKSQSALRQPSQFNISIIEPRWDAESSPYADHARQAMSATLGASSSTQIPPIKTRILNRLIPEVPVTDRAGQFNPLLQTAIKLDDENWLEVLQPLYITNRSAVWTQRAFILLESLVFSVLLIWMIRRVTRPFYHLSKAAEQFGRNPEIVEPIPATGSREIREAANSFNRMRERIRDNLGERNRMLEAMGHDLRTPLAKIQLRLDRIKPEELKNQFAANISELESIIEQGLELARSLQTSEKTVPLDIAAFAHSIVEDLADQGLEVSYSDYPGLSEEPILVLAKPTCLQRCLENLLTNAVKYAGNARMCIFRQAERVVIDINDNGPGIPDEFLEKVFEPYYRLERSRNRNSGGIGLGLSIAKNMILLNNGSLNLKNRPGGGLTAQVMLIPTST